MIPARDSQPIKHCGNALASLLMLAGLSGCQSGRPTPYSELTWDNPAFEARLQEIRDNGVSEQSQRVTATAVIEDGSMQALVDLALANNPEVLAARLRIQRLQERPAQASALEDPMLALTVGELAQTAAGQVDYVVSLTQSLPYPGTLDAREQVAQQDVLVAAAQLLDSMEGVAAEVRRVYWRRYGTARAIEVTRQQRQVLEQISEIIDARARVGDAHQADQLRVALRIADLDQQLDRLNQEMRSLDAMMNRLLNRGTDQPLPLPELADWSPRVLDRDAMVHRAEQHNPSVLVARRQVEGFRYRFIQARTERRPDLRVGVQYTAVGDDGLAPSSNGDDQFAITGAMSLPFFSDRYDAMEREALRGIGESAMGLDAAQGRAANAADDALARMLAEQSILSRLSEQMLPDSRRALELAMTGYSAGEVSFIQLMDDWQRTLDLELASHRAHARYEQAAADLSAAMGEVSGGINDQTREQAEGTDHD